MARDSLGAVIAWYVYAGNRGPRPGQKALSTAPGWVRIEEAWAWAQTWLLSRCNTDQEGQQQWPLLRGSSSGKAGRPSFWLLTSGGNNFWLNAFTHPTKPLTQPTELVGRGLVARILTEWSRKWHVSDIPCKSCISFDLSYLEEISAEYYFS